MPSENRPRYLFVVPSSCQMFSGTGTAIFDWIRFAKRHYDFSILIDPLIAKNFKYASAFCRENDIELIVGAPSLIPGCVDVGIKNIPSVLLGGEFDIVECVSWANAAVNMQVLSSLPAKTVLVYTPHAQPLWTVIEGANTACILPTFKHMLQRSTIVLLDSEPERRLSLFDGHTKDNLLIAPLGVDTAKFNVKRGRRTNMILSVCDFRESRKRVDLLTLAFEHAFARDPSLRFVLAGMGSDEFEAPASIAAAVTTLGYISQSQLISLYQKAEVSC